MFAFGENNGFLLTDFYENNGFLLTDFYYINIIEISLFKARLILQ